MFFLLRNESSNGVLKEIGPQNGGQFWTDEKKQTIVMNLINSVTIALNHTYIK